MKRLLWFASLYFVAFVSAWPQALANGSQSQSVLGATSQIYSFQNTPELPAITDIFELVNQNRINNGKQILVPDQRLTKIAQARADDMARNTYYAHRGINGEDFSDLLMQSGHSIDYGCENLDLQFVTDSNTYISDWMNSKSGHKECLLNGKVGYAGYAVTEIVPMAGEQVRTYIVVAIHSTELELL